VGARIALAIFALGNGGFWGFLAASWRWRPELVERLAVVFGTRRGHDRYLKNAPSWGRLAAALTGFWITAAALYLVGDRVGSPFAVIVLFTIAACFLIMAIVSAGVLARTVGFGDALPADAGQQPV
jgi:Flp pilus assembly protein TadB